MFLDIILTDGTTVCTIIENDNIDTINKALAQMEKNIKTHKLAPIAKWEVV